MAPAERGGNAQVVRAGGGWGVGRLQRVMCLVHQTLELHGDVRPLSPHAPGGLGDSTSPSLPGDHGP